MVKILLNYFIQIQTNVSIYVKVAVLSSVTVFSYLSNYLFSQGYLSFTLLMIQILLLYFLIMDSPIVSPLVSKSMIQPVQIGYAFFDWYSTSIVSFDRNSCYDYHKEWKSPIPIFSPSKSHNSQKLEMKVVRVSTISV